MKSTRILLTATILLALPVAFLPGCASTGGTAAVVPTPTAAQVAAVADAAKPILEAATTAAAAQYGISPAASESVFDALWGAVAQTQAGQPPAQGASDVTVGAAIQAALPANTTAAQALTLLTAAAQAAPAP